MGFVTAEKMAPSPLTIVSDLGKAIEFERKMSTSRHKVPLKDALSRVIADFNRLVTVKKHRVDTARRNLCYNLILGFNWPNVLVGIPLLNFLGFKFILFVH